MVARPLALRLLVFAHRRESRELAFLPCIDSGIEIRGEWNPKIEDL